MPSASKKTGLTRRDVIKATGAGTAIAASGMSNLVFAQASSEVDKAIIWAKASLPNSTPEIIMAAAKEGKLVLTMQQDGDDVTTQAMIRRFRERYPFIDVTYTMQSSGQLMNKFSAELAAKRGISDYVRLPSDLKETNKYITAGGIAEFVVSQDSAYPEDGKRRGLWYPWMRQNGVTVYRKGTLSEEEKKLIRSYKGLTDRRFRDRLGITNVSNSISVTGSYVVMNEDDKSIWEGLVANKPRVKSATAPLLDGLLAGDYDIALMTGFANAAVIAKDGAPIEFGISASSPVLYAPGAISALAPNPNAAKLWQDWFTSKEGQDQWVSLIGIPSARNDVAKPWAAQQPWFFEDAATHKVIDWVKFADEQQNVVARFKKDLQTG